jgi:catechol 2,3-dioxygenase-like lactoylglutathione lyase family enzyme
VGLKLEVVMVPVSDVDRAKAFYEKVGFRLDIDIANENFRGIQFTPPRSEASIIFGQGVTSAKSRPSELVLAVDDVDAARKDLIARGVEVSEIFHYAGGPFNNAVENPRVAGRDPEGRSYFSFASFEDPDGNSGCSRRSRRGFPAANGSKSEREPWTSRPLPSSAKRPSTTTTTRRRIPRHNWWYCYAPYLNARQNGAWIAGDKPNCSICRRYLSHESTSTSYRRDDRRAHRDDACRASDASARAV